VAKNYSISFTQPLSERRKIVDTLNFQADGLTDMSKGLKGGQSIWQRFESRLRTRHRKTFDAMVDPVTGQAWAALLPSYAITKPAGTQNRILYLDGTLRTALTTPKGAGHVSIRKPFSLVWGVSLGVYPLAHQVPIKRKTRKDGANLQRRFIGMKLPEDLLELRKIIQTDLVARWVSTGGKVR
jgi:hypothetical protein